MSIYILQLEDDPGDVRLIADILRDAGLAADITVAGSRAEFLTALVRGGFDLVLADYRLPGFDGLEALALWRERTPDTPFLFVTGAMGEEHAVESLKSGATDYILKENLARLVPAIGRALKGAEESARRLAAEGALRASEQFNVAVLDAFPAHIAVLDRDGKILRVNAEGRRKNAERGMAPVQPAVFILHSTLNLGNIQQPTSNAQHPTPRGEGAKPRPKGECRRKKEAQ